MSAPLFLVDRLPGLGLFTLDGPEGHHAATVQRLRAGESLLLSDGRGGTASAVVADAGATPITTSVNSVGAAEIGVGGAVAVGGISGGTGRGRAGQASLTVRVVSLDHEPAPDPRLVVVQGIAKGDRGELAVQAMTEAGVDTVVAWSASRSVVQWKGERGEKSRQRWVDTAREAAKQSRRTWLPDVTPAQSTKEVTARLAGAAGALVLHEEAEDRLATVDLPAAGEIVFVIGPEGGVAPDELASFVAAGARAVRLGQPVLRTSTAGVAALAVLSARLGRW